MVFLSLRGREFQRWGAAQAKDLYPNLRRLLGMFSVPADLNPGRGRTVAQQLLEVERNQTLKCLIGQEYDLVLDPVHILHLHILHIYI